MRVSVDSSGWCKAACLSAALALAGCVPEPADQPAQANELPRIVSLNPCIDAILVELAGPGQVLALSHYSRDPASSSIPASVATRYGTTGGTVEEVLALDPDLVLASSFIAPATRQALEQLDVRVETLGSPTSVDQSIAQVRRVAALAGRGLEGERLVRDMRQAAETADNAPPVETLLWQPGQIVPGERTLVAELMRRKGFVSHSERMGLGQADFASLESVIADPPELLLVAGGSAGQRHPLLASLAATKVEPIEPHLLFCGGRTVVGLAARLDEIRAELNQ